MNNLRVMAALAALFCFTGSCDNLRAQAEAPPERETEAVPEQLPALEMPEETLEGTLAVEFAGATAFPETELREAIARQIEAIEELGLNEGNAYDMAFFLEIFYRKKGYTQVEATAQITGPWSLRIDVVEGPLTKIGSVTIEGNRAFGTVELSDYLLGPTRERYPHIESVEELPFVEADVANGANLVQRLYTAEGYLDAVVAPPEVLLSDDKTLAHITLTVAEGIQYTFGQVTLSGQLVDSHEALLAQIADELSEPFTPGRLRAAQRKLEDYHSNRGYYAAVVEASSEEIREAEGSGDGRVPVTFYIEPGPIYRFNGVSVSGLDQVKLSFMENRFDELEGEVYDPELLDEKFRELIQTGLFDNLRINPEPLPGDELRLDIDVEEAKAKEFGVLAGYSSFEGGIFGVSYADRNLFRTGRPFTAGAEVSSRGYKGDIIYSDPWLFETDFRLQLRLYALTREVQGYSKFEYGFQPTIARKLTDHWEISAFLLAKEVSVREITIDPPELTGATEYRVTSIGLSQTLDYRNNPVNPSRGFIGVTTFDTGQIALGGDIEFVRGTARLSYYLPVTENSVLAIGARGGVIYPLDDDEGLGTTFDDESMAGLGVARLPIDERYFNGGASSVRSFVERELGPVDRGGLPIGGEAFTVFNVEYTFPIAGDLKGAVFVDAGNLVPKASDFGFDDMRYAIGAGLRYNLPIGPIRLDYGFNPSPRGHENSGAFHISFGVAF